MDFSPRSKVEQLLIVLEKLSSTEDNQQILNAVSAARFDKVSVSDMFMIIKHIRTELWPQVGEILKKKIQGRLDDYPMDEVLQMLHDESRLVNMPLPLVQSLMKETGSKFGIADVFRLQSRYELSSSQLIEMISVKQRENLARLEQDLAEFRSLNLNEASVMLDLFGTHNLPYEKLIEVSEAIKSKIIQEQDRRSFAGKIERFIYEKGLAFDSQLGALVQKAQGDDMKLVSGLESLINEYQSKIDARQVLVLLKSLPSRSITIPVGEGTEKYFDALKVAMRAYVNGRGIPNTKHAFTSSDLELMGINLNVIVMFKALNAMVVSKGATTESASLKDRCMTIINESGFHDVPGNHNPKKTNLQRPMDRATSARHLTDYFLKLVSDKVGG